MGAPKDPEKRAEWLRKLSEKSSGSSGRRGSHHSSETKKKLSKIQEGKKRKPHSQETKDKMRAKHLGKTLSEEHKKKLSERKIEFYSTEEGRKVASQNAKKHYASLTEDEKLEFLIPWIEAGKRSAEKNFRSEEARKKAAETRKRNFALLSPEEKVERLAPWIEAGINSSLSNSISKKEKELGKLLKSKGYEFETQKRIWRYYVDFFIPSRNLIIEFNGCYFHACEKCGHNREVNGISAEEVREKDRKRIEYFKSKNYAVIVIWEHDLDKIRERMIE